MRTYCFPYVLPVKEIKFIIHKKKRKEEDDKVHEMPRITRPVKSGMYIKTQFTSI